ncbi:Cmx/CmrA family chloramphenicol efflux MFS transporter [Tsukamurella sp. 1534]|uniref:Cmx/CmrA family chloramphenicol efflux MFS transporter n=1 Tax=Tsukamurella sp. 1534 TaxID=1151061 RepID=UPI0006ACFCC4|nr:Cmx/CmrA family chloramphenicol efflux MFS transporter [Tsukamurella sp. 1534]
MPLAVFVLGFGIFAQGTSELMLAGLLPELSADLGVSIPQAGLLISGFALGMMVGAPILAFALTALRVSRKHALLAFTAVFALTHVAGAVTSSYEVLLATRFVGAIVYAGFWAVAATTAVSLVPEGARARAMAVVAGGLTVATAVGLPLGTVIGQQLGWRGAFWAVAAGSLVALAAVAAAVPEDRPDTGAARPDPRREIRGLAVPRLWASYAMTALVIAALMITFAYLGAMLGETTGVPPGWIPVFLALYGVGACAGIVVGGRVADRRPTATMLAGTAGLVVVSGLLAALAAQPLAVAVLSFLLGACGFGVNPVLNSRNFAIAPQAPLLVPALTASAFNIGIAFGPWLGGALLDLGAGYRWLPATGAALAVGAAGLVLLDRRWAHRRAPVPAAAATGECLTGS